uniref:Uncharacterized protein n=1 Tax=Arundo donax TaxID=35708 RepID=A0A0A8XT67_ARUDO
MKPSAAPLSITLLKPSRPSLLGCIFTAGHLKQASAGSSTSTRASSGSGKDQTSSATGKPKEDHTSTLGGRGGYGDPHPPPFYKCEICRRRTAFYRIKCCRVVVCDFCGCYCDPEETDDEKVQVQVAEKEKLPEVKTDGEDLFLWQPFSFPADLMLCMAKREGPKLRYYFASIEDLMNPMIRSIRARVYSFVQQGINARSLSVTEEFLSRAQLS